jgi:hypothetical protein
MDFFKHWEARKELSNEDSNGMRSSKVIRDLEDDFMLLLGSPE